MATNLRLDWCSHEAAKYACEHWHYAGCIPTGKTARVGVWEDGMFIGCIIFGHSAFPSIHKPFGLTQFEVVELQRVALRSHTTQVSRMIAIALRLLKKEMPKLRLIVSFADPEQDHKGGIYQAGGWVYSGFGSGNLRVKVGNEIIHERTAKHRYGTLKGLETLPKVKKHKYLMPLDDEMRKRIEPLRKPYPKRATAEIETGGVSNADTGGANPTVALPELDRLATAAQSE